ncbi:MAG: isomerizing glutamine--fructose-6-phosphate transaminase, partial [Chloroflexi bacterium]|nr:isomerizing glutamine--fructose-6-phosphate transaminase [Chloroflexota bacterium]
ELKVYRDGVEHPLQIRKLSWTSGQTEKNGYEHFMLKEIHEQPTALRDTLASYPDGLPGLPVESPERLLLLACGTSYHAALYAELLITSSSNVSARAHVASEYAARTRGNSEGLVVAISQSGETADTLAPIRALKAAGHSIVGVTNVQESSLDRLADTVFLTKAGPEVAVASTKTFTTQMALMALLAAELTDDAQVASDIRSGLRSLPGKVEQLIARSDEIQKVAEWLAGFDHAFIVAKGAQVPVALEAALKLKEVAYMHAEGMPASELKHGPFALLTPETPVLAMVPDDENRARMVTTIREISARGAPVVALVDGESADIAEFARTIVQMPGIHGSLAPIIYTVAVQLISYYCGKARGCPIDRPRNLAKSVTVH